MFCEQLQQTLGRAKFGHSGKTYKYILYGELVPTYVPVLGIKLEPVLPGPPNLRHFKVHPRGGHSFWFRGSERGLTFRFAGDFY